MTLSNLPYTSRKEIPAKPFQTANQGFRLLTRKSAITTAKDNGAINAWYGDDRLWHGLICRFHEHVAEWESATKTGMQEWLKKALIEIA